MSTYTAAIRWSRDGAEGFAKGQYSRAHEWALDGGGTRPKAIGKTIRPETGKLLAWNNLLPDGRPNPATLHQGLKVRRGTRYGLTKWFRERWATANA
jgi:hypothetical protein